MTTRVFFSSEALQLFFLRLLPICYSPETAFLNFLGFWTRALIDDLECPIVSAGVFENFFDPLWDEVIARIGLTWQVAFESVASCSVPGITLPLHLSPTLFGKTPPISLSDEQLWRTSGTLHLPLLFCPGCGQCYNRSLSGLYGGLSTASRAYRFVILDPLFSPSRTSP